MSEKQRIFPKNTEQEDEEAGKRVTSHPGLPKTEGFPQLGDFQC